MKNTIIVLMTLIVAVLLAAQAVAFNTDVLRSETQYEKMVSSLNGDFESIDTRSEARSFLGRKVYPFLNVFRGRDGRVTRSSVHSVLVGSERVVYDRVIVYAKKLREITIKLARQYEIDLVGEIASLRLVQSHTIDLLGKRMLGTH